MSKEGLLSKDLIELSALKRRVDNLMSELASLKASHRELKKQCGRSWWNKLLRK